MVDSVRHWLREPSENFKLETCHGLVALHARCAEVHQHEQMQAPWIPPRHCKPAPGGMAGQLLNRKIRQKWAHSFYKLHCNYQFGLKTSKE